MKQLPYKVDQYLVIDAMRAVADARDHFTLHEDRLKRMKAHLTNTWLAGELYGKTHGENRGLTVGMVFGFILGAALTYGVLR